MSELLCQIYFTLTKSNSAYLKNSVPIDKCMQTKMYLTFLRKSLESFAITSKNVWVFLSAIKHKMHIETLH